jgi:hypothetical protein
VQISVPDDFEVRPRPSVRHPSEQADEQPSDTRTNGLLAGALTALEDAVSDLRQRAEGAERRAETAEARMDRALHLLTEVEGVLTKERDRSDRAETAIAGERQRSDALRDRLDHAERVLAVAQHDAQTAQEAASALRLADEARKARGRWHVSGPPGGASRVPAAEVCAADNQAHRMAARSAVPTGGLDLDA